MPLEQSVTIKHDGGVDEWGIPVPGSETEHEARVEEGSFRIIDKNGAEVTTSLKVYLEELVQVDFTDKIEYINELGHKTEREPKRIEVIRDFSSEPLFTVVYV